MANKKFLENMLKADPNPLPIKHAKSPNAFATDIPGEEEDVDESPVGDIRAKVEHVNEPVKSTVKEDIQPKEVIQEIPLATEELDFDNIPDLNLGNLVFESLNTSEDDLGVNKGYTGAGSPNDNPVISEKEATVVAETKTKRGRKKLSDLNDAQEHAGDEIEDLNYANKTSVGNIAVGSDIVEESSDKTQEQVYANDATVGHYINPIPHVDECHSVIAKDVLQYVCDQTIRNLIGSYTSKVYTGEYTLKLFNDYLNKEEETINSQLFKALISECIETKVVDPYLNDLTISVLEYIKAGK